MQPPDNQQPWAGAEQPTEPAAPQPSAQPPSQQWPTPPPGSQPPDNPLGGYPSGYPPPYAPQGYNQPGYYPPVPPGYYPEPYPPRRQQISFDVIGEAWRLVSSQFSTWVVACLLLVVIYTVLYSCITGVTLFLTVGSPAFQRGSRMDILQLLQLLQSPALQSPTFQIAGYLQQVVLNFLVAGLFHMALKQMRGEAISLGDAFDFWYAAPQLLIAAFITGLAETVGMRLYVLPAFIVGGLLMFVIPAILDKRVTAFEAISMSFKALGRRVLMASLFYFVISLIFYVGLCFCLIGALLTFPVFVMANTLAYRDFLMEMPVIPLVQAANNYPPPPIPDPHG